MSLSHIPASAAFQRIEQMALAVLLGQNHDGTVREAFLQGNDALSFGTAVLTKIQQKYDALRDVDRTCCSDFGYGTEPSAAHTATFGKYPDQPFSKNWVGLHDNYTNTFRHHAAPLGWQKRPEDSWLTTLISFLTLV